MPELRQNVATKEWVIIATERARRPEEFAQASKERVEDRPSHSATCPFCPGNEELDLERLRLPGQDDWTVRVVRNRYPALNEEADLIWQSSFSYPTMMGVGYHEIVVESRQHNTSPATETIEELAQTLRAFQIRGQAFSDDPRIAHIIYFKNHGLSAGASLVHPHAQMLGLPVLPSNVHSRMLEAQSYYAEHGACVICQMRALEEHDAVRVIASTEHFTAFIPYAAFSPFHLWIVPKQHRASFLDATPQELTDLAGMLRLILHKIYVGLNDPDYNYVLRSAPPSERGAAYTHWYVAVIPRVTRTAGFEMGTGMFINTALPEASAQFLRSVVR